MYSHLIRYPCPISIGSPWNTGIILGSLICTQLCTGILLGVHYSPGIYTAYYSVIHTYREVYHGSVYRLLHSLGSSGIHSGVLVHVTRGAPRGSYIYVSGVLSTGPVGEGVLMAVAFLGYVLPWGAMSYWGATVITNLYTGIPCMVPWLVGGYTLGGPSIPRYFMVHPLLPVLVSVSLVFHVLYLHGGSTGTGTGYGSNSRVHLHLWLVYKDVRVCMGGGAPGGLVQVYQGTVVLAHPDNSVEASVVFTPLHIVPEWYYLGYYSVLKAVPGKTSGFLVVVTGVLGAGTRGEPYGGTGTLVSPGGGGIPGTGRYTLVLVLVAPLGVGTWVGVQLPQGTMVYYGRGCVWVSVGCNLGYTRSTPSPQCPCGPPRSTLSFLLELHRSTHSQGYYRVSCGTRTHGGFRLVSVVIRYRG